MLISVVSFVLQISCNLFMNFYFFFLLCITFRLINNMQSNEITRLLRGVSLGYRQIDRFFAQPYLLPVGHLLILWNLVSLITAFFTLITYFHPTYKKYPLVICYYLPTSIRKTFSDWYQQVLLLHGQLHGCSIFCRSWCFL